MSPYLCVPIPPTWSLPVSLHASLGFHTLLDIKSRVLTLHAVLSPLAEKTPSITHVGMEHGPLRHALDHRVLRGVLDQPCNANYLEPKILPTVLALTWGIRGHLAQVLAGEPGPIRSTGSHGKH